MSAYNDYMVKASSYFVSLAELYCNLLSQGVDDCCIKNKLNIIAMYLDTIPRCGNENCLSTEQIMSMTDHLNDLAGYPGWGTLTNVNPISLPVSVSPIAVASTTLPEAWNVVIGTDWEVITFSRTLGTSGSSWAMSYTAVNSTGDTVFPTIRNRTANGFEVRAYEENVTFQGTAILNTI